jgi:hypothetical protein
MQIHLPVAFDLRKKKGSLSRLHGSRACSKTSIPDTMIDLAISIDDNPRGVTIIETNHGNRLLAPAWPQDSDFRLVVFRPNAKECEVIPPGELACDIARALELIERNIGRMSKKPDWYRRLKKCASGAGDAW